jgi:hypothetical protein
MVDLGGEPLRGDIRPPQSWVGRIPAAIAKWITHRPQMWIFLEGDTPKYRPHFMNAPNAKVLLAHVTAENAHQSRTTSCSRASLALDAAPPKTGGELRIPSFRTRNGLLKQTLGSLPHVASYRSGLAQSWSLAE